MAGISLSNDNCLFITPEWRVSLLQHRENNDRRMLTVVFTAEITLPLRQCVQFRRAGRWDKHPQCPQALLWPPTSDVLDVKCHRAPELFPGQGGGLGEGVGVWRWEDPTMTRGPVESLECKSKSRHKRFIRLYFHKSSGGPGSHGRHGHLLGSFGAAGRRDHAHLPAVCVSPHQGALTDTKKLWC